MRTIRQAVGNVLATLFFAISVYASASANTVFYDDFSDGSTTNNVPLDRDGNPVVWTPVSGLDVGTFDASTGDYVLTTAAAENDLVAVPSSAILGDTSVRTRIRLEGSPASIAVLARGNVAELSAYQAGISTITGNAYIVRNQSPTGDPLVLASTPTPVDVSNEDALLQFDVLGNRLRMFVWRPGEPMPVTPTLAVTDDVLSDGAAGVLIDTGDPGAGSAVFRYVHVADMHIPEPSAIILSAYGLLACLIVPRNRHP